MAVRERIDSSPGPDRVFPTLYQRETQARRSDVLEPSSICENPYSYHTMAYVTPHKSDIATNYPRYTLTRECDFGT